MAGENDMNLHIRTTADASGAKETEEVVKDVVDATRDLSQVQPSAEGFGPLISAARNAEDAVDDVGDALKDTGAAGKKALDPVEEAIRKIDEAADDAQKEIDELNEDLQQMEVHQKRNAEAGEAQAKSLKNIETAGKAVVAMQLAGMLQGLVKDLRAATDEGGNLHQSMGHLTPALEGVEGAVNVVTTGLTTFISTGNPALAVLGGLAAGAQGVVAAYNDMRAAQERLEDSPRRLAEEIEFARQKQRELGDEIRRQDALKVYIDQADALERQVKATERLNDLNNSLNNAKVRMAQAEASIARTNGGDVALADTNVLAARFEAQMEALNGQLREATDRATAARAASDEAFEKARIISEKTGENIADVERLQDEASKAFEKANESDRALADTIQKTDSDKAATIREFEASLASLNKTTEQMSSAAKTAGDQLFQQLNQEMAQIGQAVPKITGEAAKPVVEQIKEVDTGIKQERGATVTAIQGLAPKSADVQAVVAAVKSAEDGIQGFGNQTITALTSLTATVQALTTRQGQILEQVQSISSMIR